MNVTSKDGSGPRFVEIEGSTAQVSRAERAVRFLFPVIAAYESRGAKGDKQPPAAGVERKEKVKRQRQVSERPDVPKVIITGGCGNMGTKAVRCDTALLVLLTTSKNRPAKLFSLSSQSSL